MEGTVTNPRPRRRRKTQAEIFKESYLPYLILLTAAVLIIIFIIGAVSRSNAAKDTDGDTASYCVTVPVQM